MRIQILFQILLSTLIYAQAVFEPVNSDVYDFLEKHSIKGNISFNYEIKPILRIEIAKYIILLDQLRDNLNNLDKELLEFYKSDYDYEINNLSTGSDPAEDKIKIKPEFFITDSNKRIRLFEYAGKDFSLFADPMLSFSLESIAGERLFIRRNGLSAYGYIMKNWGYSFSFFDNEESGKNLDIYKNITSTRGTSVTKLKKDAFEYDVVNASLSYQWDNGCISIGKEYFNFGNGRYGNIILSDKAPSFPFIRLDYKPVDWLSFFYFHGFLVSNVIDSSSIRTGSFESRVSLVDIPKFLAFHSISIYPSRAISLTFGESIVYSEFLQPVYFIPIMFFRVADHYLSRGNASATGNAQLFADASYINSDIKSKFYGSVFIDELSFNSLFSGGNLSAVGFTAGIEARDFLVENSKLGFEYSRLNPFLYMNSVTAQTFKNDDYSLGHWIGSNGDIISISYGQYLTRALSLSVQFNYLRKGKTELPKEQYSQPYPETLYGERLNISSFEFKVKFKPYHPLNILAYYRFENVTDSEEGRLPEYRAGKMNNFGITASYGF